MMRRAGVFFVTVLLIAATAMAATQQEKAKQKGNRKGGERAGEAAPPEKTGVAIGEKAPAFTLKDQAGKDRPLDELLKNGKLAVVFHRSASW
jgi:hypothetical protein